ncbi:MAG TPA: geranylgeranyl reductase family protein [Chitinophagales bacterium]|nr:geranylgeranyl reductase family protein [Chitinophagales bacterium]
MPTIQTDVLIIGAGPAGASAALFLAKKGIASVIVDKESFPRDKICGDALSGKAVEVLNKLDKTLVPEIAAHDKFLGSYGVTFVAPNGQSLRVPFQTKKEKTTAPGFISKRIDFDNWLVEKVKASKHIQLYVGTEIRHYRREAGSILADANNGTTYSAKIVIACDGAYSTFTKDIAGIKTEPEHNCFGLRAYYKNVNGLDQENFIELHFLKEFLPGYFWIFPLPNGGANIGVGMRADKMHDKKVNLKKSFESILANNPVMKERFDGAERVGDIKLFGLPLGSKKRTLSGDNFLLCGDAAMLIDPFTGEGIGNAMFSGLYAANQVERSLQQNNFSAASMQQYDKELYGRLWSELLLSYRMQQLVNFPALFNFVVRKANSNKVLSETISCMFEDLDMRARLKNPMFYLRLLFAS